MKLAFAVSAVLLLAVPAAFAYQVTGPVLDVNNDTIVVEKNKEKWEIQRDKDTKVTGELKKGSKVTVQYRMTATTIESKDKASDAKGKDKDAKGAAKKDAAPVKK
jgi:hypothetical protein